MTSTLLTNELNNLITEAKRKNADLRSAAEKALQDLKALPVTSEQQLAADLSRRSAFIEPFLIACATRNTKFAGSGVTCLQRLIISRGLPKARLKEALEALNSCTNLGLEIQLKILQALPSLLQNYADDLKGDLLSDALEVCSSLQSAKAPTVSGVAAATLQQLVTTIFERVANEDRSGPNAAAVHEVQSEDGPIRLRPAAFDAYRVFRDLALAAEDRKPDFVQFASLSQEATLELIRSCISTNAQVFASHAELNAIVRMSLLPLITRALSEKLSFPLTVRYLRILDLILGPCVAQDPAESVLAIGLLTHTLDPDAAPSWKRALAMEILRNFFADGSNVIIAYAAYDMADGGKPIIQNLMSAFVRLSAEKPSAIGLGQQSTVPAGATLNKESNDQTSADAGSVAGMISSALGVAEANVAGISSRWSVPRAPCLEQLDKSDPPSVPETYIYSLVLDCMGSLSDGLAKVILPLTVHHEKPKAKTQNGLSTANGEATRPRAGRVRSQSYLERTVPLNPLDREESVVLERVRAVNSLVETCWPAFLATSSTFLNAALDDQYYRNLIKAYQRFAQVAGLLRLNTARDALVTTLGKAAIPPHVVNTALAESIRSPTAESPRVFSNPKSLLSVDSLVSQTSTLAIDRDRNRSSESPRAMLTARNLLCLRALLNLAIALGPTLTTAFAVIVDTLRQADLILSATTPQQMIRQGLAGAQAEAEPQTMVQAFSNEVAAVEAAASRLLESTADYPDDAFLVVLDTFCSVLHSKDASPVTSPGTEASPPPTPTMISRTFSGFTGLGSIAEMQARNYKFVIPRLGNLAELNVSRFAYGNSTDTGWNLLVEELLTVASNNAAPIESRRAATSVSCKAAANMIAEVMEEDVETRTTIQRRTLAVLLRLIDGMYEHDGDLTSSDIEIQGYVLDALQAILERCGESLVAGWNRILAILSSAFERDGPPPDRKDNEGTYIDWDNISKDLIGIQLGRSAFAAAQLICSDFLSALPLAIIPSLIELLHRFATQTDDLNISLSTITMAWNVSDFLIGAVVTNELEEVSLQLADAADFEEGLRPTLSTSKPSQWLLLLLRLKSIVQVGNKEVRKAAFQTICSILKSNGTKLSAAVWDLSLRSIILRIAFSDVWLYQKDEPEKEVQQSQETSADEEMSAAILTGTSEVISQHLGLIERDLKLASLWESFLSRLEAYLDLEKRLITTAVFQTLNRVLSQVNSGSKVWLGPMYRTLSLWLKRNPGAIELEGKGSNEEPLIAYVEAGNELYRLTHHSMSTSQTRTLVENLYLSIRNADSPGFGADMNLLSSLQEKAFESLKTVRSDNQSTCIIVASKLSTLAHDMAEESSRNNGPTFIAIATQSMDWLRELVLLNITEKDLIDTGVTAGILESLRHVIEQKYEYTSEHKGHSLWQKAAATSIALSNPVLLQIEAQPPDSDSQASIWRELVKTLRGVITANKLELLSDPVQAYEDESVDLESFQKLRDILIPRLGEEHLPDSIRNLYARALFDASIVHSTEHGEIPGPEESPLHEIGKIRRGRVKHVLFSQRERMCYECFRELVNLSVGDTHSAERRRLALAAMPFLILRLAIPVRAYIADQPLRGRKPQLLSQLEELLFCFDVIKRIANESNNSSADQDVSNRLERSCLHHLLPLLMKAVGTAGDRWSGADEVLKPLQSLLEYIASKR